MSTAGPHESLHDDRGRAESFGAEAERYDRVRPRYPPALVAHLLEGAGADTMVLDVGCGTGIAARLFRDHGATVLGVEPDARMARVARRHGLAVEVSSFERWQPHGRRFELLISAQAWHWVDPVLGASKAASVLAPGGRVALFWNFGAPAPVLGERLDAVYARLEPELERYSVLLGKTDERLSSTSEALALSGRFTPPQLHTWTWTRRYEEAEWLEQLLTHSDHHALPAARREALMEALAGAVADHGDGIEITYRTRLVSCELL